MIMIIFVNRSGRFEKVGFVSQQSEWDSSRGFPSSQVIFLINHHNRHNHHRHTMIMMIIIIIVMMTIIIMFNKSFPSSRVWLSIKYHYVSNIVITIAIFNMISPLMLIRSLSDGWCTWTLARTPCRPSPPPGWVPSSPSSPLTFPRCPHHENLNLKMAQCNCSKLLEAVDSF